MQTTNRKKEQKPSANRRPNTRNRTSKNKGYQKTKAAPFDSKKENNKLKIIALGGLQEVGKNMTVFEYEDDIIIVDIGLMFPDEDQHGIDYIIPNTAYLKGKEKNIRGVIVTHGHLDHIGAGPIILPRLGNPLVIGAPMTMALLKRQIENYHQKFTPQIKEIKSVKETVTLGKFKISFFQVEHSIKDALGVIIQTPEINVIHPGDWRYDLDPIEGKPTDLTHLAKWNTRETPSVLMMESLGSTQQGHQGSEREVYENIRDIIKNANGRVIFATFASMLERIGQVIKIAEQLDKKVAVDGFSMKSNIEIGKKFGFIKYSNKTVVDISKINSYDPKKAVVICTGSQGEDRAVLNRIANKEHKHIKIEKNDTVVFSSSVIPGNERTIQSLKDTLYRQGAHVIHKEIMDVHAGGHGKIEDIKLLLKQVKPKYLMPVYANHYLLREAAIVAQGDGFPAKDILVADNGQIVEFDKNGARVTDKRVPVENVFVDGLGVGDISDIVLRDRRMMADDGMIVIIITLNKGKGELVQNPDIISRGFIYMKENKKLIEETRSKTRKIFKGNLKEGVDESYYKEKIRKEIGQFLYQKTERRPVLIPVIIQF